jgi:flagellar biosynthesis repressor protein FlbT
MHISLRAGEKIYINGAVLRADRKVSLELLNDATFLLAAHVMKVEDASTPLRQLYFIIQIMLMNPTDSLAAREMFKKSIHMTIDVTESGVLISGLRTVKTLVDDNRIF